MDPSGPIDSHSDGTARAVAESRVADALRIALRRRRFVIDRQYQLRVAFLSVGIALVLLVLLNASLFFSARQNSAVAVTLAPQLAEFMKAQDRVQFGLVLTGSLVFLVGVFLVGILESHRTAGAAFKISQGIDRLRQGDTRSRVRLRRGDNLQDVAAAVNTLAGALQQEAWEQVETLEEISSRLEQVSAEPAVAEATHALRTLAIRNRRRLESENPSRDR